MPSPPSFRKVNPADQPILYLALSSPTLPLSEVDEYAETFLAQRISMVSGVAQVQVFGSQKYAVRVQLDPRELASRQLGINEVENAVERGNVNLPTGTLWGSHQAVTVQANGQLTDAAAYRPLIVAYRNGSPVRLEELGRVINSVENDKIASWFNGTRAVVLAILRQPGTNTVEVVDNIKALFPNFRALLPPAVSLNILYDRSVSIRDSVGDVKFTLLLTVALVVMVIFLFLRNLSATVIPSLALPFSIVGTFAVMFYLGYNLDNLSLMALTLSVGFVVDDAIVMLENIVRHMELGEPPLRAALNGSKEIGFTILSMTVSLAAVFIPVLFMPGLISPFGLFSQEDNAQIFVFTEAAEGISFDSMVEHQKALAAIIQKEPAVEAFFSSAGARGIASSNNGLLFMHLKPRRERAPIQDLVDSLRSRLSQVPGIRAYPQIPPSIRIGGSLTKSLYQYTLQGPNTGELYRVAPLMEAKIRALPGFLDVNSDLQIKNPQVELDIQRDKAATLGVTASQIEDALYDAYGARQISTIYPPNNEYQVILQLLPDHL